MTSMKARRALRSQKHASARSLPEGSRSHCGQFERLETRELLSSFQPTGVNFQWMTRGKFPLHEIRFDGDGNCLTVLSPLAQGNDCSLDQFGSAPNRISVPFNSTILRSSLRSGNNVQLSGDLDPANPLHISRTIVSRTSLVFYVSGGFALNAAGDLDISIQGLQGRRPIAEFMDPWNASFDIHGTGGNTTPGGDTTPPMVLSLTPTPGSFVTQPPTFIEALFSEDLNENTATSPGSLRLIRSVDGTIGNGNDVEVFPSSLTYDRTTARIRFNVAGTLPADVYHTSLSANIQDRAGNFLDGDSNGFPGGAFSAMFRLNTSDPQPQPDPQPPTPSNPVGPQPTVSPGDITPPVVTHVFPSFDGVVQASPSTLLVTFSEPLNPAAINGSTVQVFASGSDGGFGNPNDHSVLLQSVTYNAGTRQAVIQLAQVLNEDTYRIELSSGGIKDLAGNELDGNRDGRGGGTFTTDFRVDRTPPQVTLALGSGSDTGVQSDNRTKLSRNLTFGGSVQDGTAVPLANYTVRLDIDGDGFDDGQSATDPSGNFLVSVPPQFVAQGTMVARVQVADRAGNTSVAQTTFVVDQIQPVAGFTLPVVAFDRAPATLEAMFHEPMNPDGARDLKNYALISSGGDGLFYNNVADASPFLTGATYDAAHNKVILSVSPSLPAGSYRLVVRSEGTLQDLAGNLPYQDVFQDVRVAQLTRTSGRPANAPKLNPSNIRQFPQLEYTVYETADPTQTYRNQTLARRRPPGPLVDPTQIVMLPESEPVLGPASNNSIPTCESATGSFAFGQDSGEDPNIVITGTDFGLADTDFYCFRARAGELVFFQVTDDTGFIIPTFPLFRIWDLGTDGAAGGTGDAADRPLIGETFFQFFFTNAGVTTAAGLIPDFVEGQITGISGTAMDNPDRQVDITLPNGSILPGNPLGSEDRAPQDRVYALELDTDRFNLTATPQNYIITGQFRKPFTTSSQQQQIVYVDFDGAQGVRGFEDISTGNPISVNVPPFDVRDYGFDPIFQDQFIDELMANLREEFERVQFQEINTGQNTAQGIRRYSYELRDSRHYPDPGNAANVSRINIGGTATIAGLPFGVLGIAEEVDTGNKNGANNVLVFSKDIARFDLLGVAPLGFGPSRIPELATELAQVASHEVGHTLGLWHTRMEGFEFCDVTITPTCTPDFDNIIDPFISPLGTLTDHRFDFFRDSLFILPNGTISPLGLEFFEGVADSVGTMAWDMTGRDSLGPRVIDLEVTPGEIKIVFSEGIDIATLVTDGITPTIRLERADFDNDFTGSVPITLLPVGVRGPAPSQEDPCTGAIPANVSLYDACIATITLKVADLSQVEQDDIYRLTLVSTGTQGLRDLSGNALDGEINLPVNRRASPQGERFPSGDGEVGGSMQLSFLVTKNIGVDADFTAATTGVQGTTNTPFTSIQQGVEAAEFANLASELDAAGKQKPVSVRVAPSASAYLAYDSRLDPTPLTTNDRGHIIIPANTHLILDGNSELAEGLYVAVPSPDDPATTRDESAELPGTIFRMDTNSIAGGGARQLAASFPTPLPIPGNVGLAYDGNTLYFVRDVAGADNDPDSLFTMDALTGAVTNTFILPSSPDGNNNISGLAVDESILYLADSESNRIFRVNKSTLALIDSFTTGLTQLAGLDFDAATRTLWVSGVSGAGVEIRKLNAISGAVLGTFAGPTGSTGVAGVGVVDGTVFVADPTTDRILQLNPVTNSYSQSFASPGLNPGALTGVPVSQLVVKLLGTRIEASGANSAIVATGRSIDNPVFFTSTRDNTVLGSGESSAAPADWMGIAFRPGSDDFVSRLENVAIHFAGGPGSVIPNVTQTLSPVTLFDARPTIVNAEISSNTEAAIAATPDSFERLLNRSGPELFWEVDAGVPIQGDWCTDNPATAGVIECQASEFGLFQNSTGKLFLDLDGDQILDAGERPVQAFGQPGETPVVGNFSGLTAGDEIATFDRRIGIWTIDRNRDFIVSQGVIGLPDDVIAIQYGQHGDFPIAGDWDGDGVDQIGVYRPRPRLSDTECLTAVTASSGCFLLDLNNDFLLQANEEFVFGDRDGKPVVGNFSIGVPGDEIGIYRSTSGDFLLDRNGNRRFDPEERDLDGDNQEDINEVTPGSTPNGILDKNDGPFVFGSPGATPVVGDWAPFVPGDEIGVVNTALGWTVDANGNLRDESSEQGKQFGQAGDLIAPAQWAGNSAVALLGTAPSGFALPASVYAIEKPAAVVLADLNAAGGPDMIVANDGTGTIDVLLNNGAGVFGAPTRFPVGRSPQSITLADVNGDLRTDLIVVNAGGNGLNTGSVSVLLGNGAGGFAAASNFATGNRPSAVAVGNIDGIGGVDLAVTNSADNTVSILLGDGVGGFVASGIPPLRVGQRPSAVGIGNMDADTLTDLVVVNGGSNNLNILSPAIPLPFTANPATETLTVPGRTFANGEIVRFTNVGGVLPSGLSAGTDLFVINSTGNTFNVAASATGTAINLTNAGTGTHFLSAVRSVSTGINPSALFLGNIDAVAGLDLAVVNAGSNNVTILRTAVAGGFTPAVNVSVGTQPIALTPADTNGDTILDFVVANSGSNNISILQGNGAGGFVQQATRPSVQGAPVSVAAGDVNGDGRQDVVALVSGSEFGVFRQASGVWFIDKNANKSIEQTEDLDLDGILDKKEDKNQNNKLDVGEDLDGDRRLDVDEDKDPDGTGPLRPNLMLDTNDGAYPFSAALRNDINLFVFNNSLNAVWVKPGFQTVADAHWNDVQLPHVLTGTVEVQAFPQIGVVPTLETEPGLVVKMGLANISVSGFGSTLLVDSDLEVDEPRVLFTSLQDDAHGPSGRKHDTNNDSAGLAPLPGDWGGIVVGQGSSAIVNGAEIQYAGNLRVPFRGFCSGLFPTSGLVSPNPITLNGGPVFATITNNIIANTNNLANTANSRTRPSDIAAIGVVDANSLGPGPNTARVAFNANPFVRGNDVSTNNGLNGLEIRTDCLQADAGSGQDITVNTFISQSTVWDDSDITHILLGTLNWSSAGGVNLTLRSNPTGTYDEFDGVLDGPAESLVVKLGGRFSTPFTQMSPLPAAGIPITIGAGFQLGWDDGNANTPCQNCVIDSGFDGTLIVEGVPGNADLAIPQTPVILTSLMDDTVGPAGPEDTNNDAAGTTPQPGDWGGIVLGAWSRNFGRISPLNNLSLTESYVRDADVRFASTGVVAQSQPAEISNSIIRNSRDFGIHALQGPDIPTMPTATVRIPAPVHVWNSILFQNNVGIQQIGGPDNANIVLESQVPRSVIINNTLHENTTALNLATRAGSLVMNNAITSVGNVGTGILIDGSSLNLPFETPPQHERPQIIRNLFFGLANNGLTGTTPRGLGGLEIIGADPGYADTATFNFRPTSGSPLVDSAMSEFGDSTSTLNFFDPLWGLVNAPERDKLGSFRRDHFGTSGIGIGLRPWLDLGAVELVEIVSGFPTIISMTPTPNSNFPNDQGPVSVELEFSEPVSGVGTSTFFVEASGLDRSFSEGNETRLTGQVSAVAGSNSRRWVFVPDSSNSFNSFRDEVFRVTARGSGSQPIVSVATGKTLDGNFIGSFPTGDGIVPTNDPTNDYKALFTIGDVVTGTIIFIDDDAPAGGDPNSQDPIGSVNNPYQRIIDAFAPAPPPGSRPQLRAVAGDTIRVFPGCYRDPIVLTIPVTLESTDGAQPRKDSNGFVDNPCSPRTPQNLRTTTGTIIQVITGQPAILLQNLSGQEVAHIGSTRGGQNHGFIITTTDLTATGAVSPQGIAIDIQSPSGASGAASEIEGNLILSNTNGIRANTGTSGKLPTITNNLILGNTISGIELVSTLKDPIGKIVNNTVSFNQGGIQIRNNTPDSTTAQIHNNVITSNTDFGLNVAGQTKPLVRHNNVWNNNSQQSNFVSTNTELQNSRLKVDRFDAAGNPLVDADCTPPQIPTDATRVCGNIATSPLFRLPVDPRAQSDRTDFFRFANFELQSASKLIDRALDTEAAPRDFKGTTRNVDIPNVGRNGTAPPEVTCNQDPPRCVDIGAFEFVPGTIASASGERRGGGRQGHRHESNILGQASALGLSKAELKQLRNESVLETESITDYLLEQLGSRVARKTQDSGENDR